MNEILEILKEDSRATAKDISIMLGKPEEEIKEVIEKLEEDKIILKYTTIVNEEKWNDDKVQAFIEVRVNPEREKGFDAIAERIYKFPQVKSMYLMSGAYDFSVIVEGKDLKEVAMFVSQKLSTLDYVVGTATHFILKKYKEKGIQMEGSSKIDRRIAVSP